MCMKSGQAGSTPRSRDPMDRSDGRNLEAFAVRQFGRPKATNMPGSGPLLYSTNPNYNLRDKDSTTGKPQKDLVTYDDDLSRAAGEPTLYRAPPYTLPSQQRSLMSTRQRVRR